MTGHTATEKILALRGGRKEVFPGDVVTCDVDGIFVHSPWFFLDNWKLIGGVNRCFDPDKLILGLGHHVCLPASNQYANDLAEVRKAAKKFGFKHVYDMGTGNGHIIMLEKGHVRPGYVYVGADSHSTIYGAAGAFGTALSYEVPEILLSGKAWFKVPQTVRVTVESKTGKGVCARDVAQYVLSQVGSDGALWRTMDFSGSYIHSLSMYQRMIFSLLAVEMGAVTGFIEPDDMTRSFLHNRVRGPYECVYNDPDCAFEREWPVDAGAIEPMIACPPRPTETKRVSEVEGQNIKVHQAYIGGCTGSSLEDFRMAADVLRGRSIHPDTRLPGPIRPPSEDREEAASPTGLDWGVMILFSAVLGCLLNGLHVPAGRLLGAAAFTAVYTRARRLRPRLHPVWHNAVLSSIGGSAGLNVTAASLLSLPALIVPLTGYLCLTASAVAAAYFLLRTFGGYDPLTALFSASMGGLSPSIAAADAMGADTATVTVFQILRYFSVVILALTLGYLL